MTTEATDRTVQDATSAEWDDGEEIPDDDVWATAGLELGPHKSLARVTGTSRALISSVSLVALAMTALGLAGTQVLARDPVLRTLAGIAALLGLAAALLALSFGAARPEKLNTFNLEEVRHWYDRHFRRAWRVTWATWLLILAVALATVVGAIALFTPSDNSPMLTLAGQGSGSERMLDLQVKVANQEAGAAVVVTLTGADDTVIYRASGITDASGGVSISASVESVAPATSYRLSAQVGGRTTTVTLG